MDACVDEGDDVQCRDSLPVAATQGTEAYKPGTSLRSSGYGDGYCLERSHLAAAGEGGGENGATREP